MALIGYCLGAAKPNVDLPSDRSILVEFVGLQVFRAGELNRK